GRAHDERNGPARPVVGGYEPGEVVAADPVRGDRERVGDRPGESNLSRGRIGRDRVVGASGAIPETGRQAGDEPTADAAVPAEAEDLDPVVDLRRRRHV